MGDGVSGEDGGQRHVTLGEPSGSSSFEESTDSSIGSLEAMALFDSCIVTATIVLGCHVPRELTSGASIIDSIVFFSLKS